MSTQIETPSIVHENSHHEKASPQAITRIRDYIVSRRHLFSLIVFTGGMLTIIRGSYEEPTQQLNNNPERFLNRQNPDHQSLLKAAEGMDRQIEQIHKTQPVLIQERQAKNRKKYGHLLMR